MKKAVILALVLLSAYALALAAATLGVRHRTPSYAVRVEKQEPSVVVEDTLTPGEHWAARVERISSMSLSQAHDEARRIGSGSRGVWILSLVTPPEGDPAPHVRDGRVRYLSYTFRQGKTVVTWNAYPCDGYWSSQRY